MKIEMSGAYCSNFRVFRINDIDADVDDFGISEDSEPWNAPEYGCGNRQFHPYDDPSENVLEKYHITYYEWTNICDILCRELDWGRCALCE